MNDQRLRDLLHETVGDVSGPDLADTAWRSGLRARRRRAAALAAGATAVVVGIAGTVALGDRDPASSGPATQSPAPAHPTPSVDRGAVTYDPTDDRPDARYAGRPVWWAPTLAEEARLPAYDDSPFPAVIDVRAPAQALSDHPVGRAVAAFAGMTEGVPLEFVEVLAPDGSLRTVDTSPVQPMTDPEGNQRVRAGASMLSPSGEYLMFPQQHSVLVLTLRTGQWRTVDTGSTPTWDATWVNDRELVLPDLARPRAEAPTYPLDGGRSGGTNLIGTGIPPIPLGGSLPYGRVRTGSNDAAQAFYPGADIPQPPALHLSPGQSDWIAVNGTHSSVLLVPGENGRQKACCQVDGWIGPDTLLYDSASAGGTRLVAWDVGTGRFRQVTRLTGVSLGDETVVASYARLWLPGPLLTP
jgi:hypothetical protein